MNFPLKKIHYKDLNSRQKENYNFQKVAGELADYGFNCLRLTDDWQGADFIAWLIYRMLFSRLVAFTAPAISFIIP